MVHHSYCGLELLALVLLLNIALSWFVWHSTDTLLPLGSIYPVISLLFCLWQRYHYREREQIICSCTGKDLEGKVVANNCIFPDD